jgi:nucleoside-diphosphate-sugar epimerase
MVMRVFVAGGTGVLGRRLVPQLVAQPDAIVHQMTAISVAHAGKPDMRRMDRWFARTIRLCTEGMDLLLAAAEATGVSNFVAQGYASWSGIREGRGFSNAKGKRELGRQLRYPSWHQGFKEGLA